MLFSGPWLGAEEDAVAVELRARSREEEMSVEFVVIVEFVGKVVELDGIGVEVVVMVLWELLYQGISIFWSREKIKSLTSIHKLEVHLIQYC